MKTLKFVYWEGKKYLVGYLQDYPEYWTQGENLQDLEEHLRDIYAEVLEGNLPDDRPASRKVGELVV